MAEPAEPDEESTESPRRSPASRGVLAALRAELAGFEVQDRDVELSSGDATLRADWVGTERAGRIVVAAWLPQGTDDAAIVWAVEAVTFAQRLDAQDPARKHDPAPVPSLHRTLAALIVPRVSERLKAALALLPSESFALFEIASRERGGHGRPVLSRCELRGAGGVASGAGTGIDAWPPAARALAESLAARVRRIDPALEGHVTPHGLAWRWRGDERAGLSLTPGGLLGSCAASGKVQPIADETGAEAWLEQIVRAHCRCLRTGTSAARPADLLARGRPLLSPEELAAFRE